MHKFSIPTLSSEKLGTKTDFVLQLPSPRANIYFARTVLDFALLSAFKGAWIGFESN